MTDAHRAKSWTLALCALALAPALAHGQISIYPVQDLAFGQVQGGIPTVVTTADAVRRAELDIVATGTFTLTTFLPTNMVSLAGDRLPITFSTTSGRIRWRRFGVQYDFDPNTPTTLWLPWLANGATVYIGGTANPAPTQPPGVYRATVTLIITNAGT